MSDNLSTYIKNTIGQYNNILFLLENKAFDRSNYKIQSVVSDFNNIEQLLIEHMKDEDRNYQKWCDKTISKITKLKTNIESKSITIKNYQQQYKDNIKLIIDTYTKTIKTINDDINKKILEPVEWYQVIDNNDNLTKVLNNIIQPILYPNLYSNNRKIFLFGDKHLGKYYFSRAMVTNLLKVDIDYNILVVNTSYLIFNNETITIDQLNKLLFDNHKLIVIIHNLDDNLDFYKTNLPILEKYKPIWIISNSNDIEDIYNYDIKLEFSPFTLESIHLLVNSFISNYLINDNPYYSVFEPFKKTIYSDMDIIPKLSHLYQSRYKYLSYYDIPILNNINLLKQANSIMYQRGYNINQISKIISNSINTLSQISLKNNTYYLDRNIYVSTLSSKTIPDSIYYLTPPIYKELILNDNGSGKLCRKCHNNCSGSQKYIHLDLIPNLLKLEDDRITDFFILEQQTHNISEAKCLDLICKLEWNITNKMETIGPNYHLSKIVITIYIGMVHYLLTNEEIQLTNSTILLDKIKNINCLTDLNTLSKEEIKEYFNLLNDMSPKLLSNMDRQLQTIYLKCDNETSDGLFDISFKNTKSSNLNGYQNGIPKNISINKFQQLIYDLVSPTISNIDVQVIAHHMDEDLSYIWEIEFYTTTKNDKMIEINLQQLLKVSTRNSNDTIDISSSINIPSNIFKLDKSYNISSIYDVDILQQSHLNYFSSIDREDEETWNTTPLKTQHLDILNNRHSPEILFLLYLSTYLKIYSTIYQENDELEILNIMITAKIKQLFEISYQDDTQENMDWFVSDNHFDLVYPNNDRNSSQFNISTYYWILLIHSFQAYPNFNSLFDMWNLVYSIDKNKYIHKTTDIYIKTHLDLNKIDISHCYYSFYGSNNYNDYFQKDKYRKMNKVLLHKVSTNSSLLYIVLNNCDSIGFNSTNNNIRFYSINNSNWINNINTTNKDLVFPNLDTIINETTNYTGIQNTIAFLLANIYTNNHNHTKVANSYLAGLLTQHNYISYRPNYDLEKEFNLLELINHDIVNNISSLSNYLDMSSTDTNDINKNSIIENKPIATGSLTKNTTMDTNKIIQNTQNIFSYHLRSEYINDELI